MPRPIKTNKTEESAEYTLKAQTKLQIQNMLERRIITEKREVLREVMELICNIDEELLEKEEELAALPEEDGGL